MEGTSFFLFWQGIHKFGKYNSSQGGKKGGNHGWPQYGCGVGGAVLAAVGNHVDRDQLEGGNIEDQEGAHVLAGKFAVVV